MSKYIGKMCVCHVNRHYHKRHYGKITKYEEKATAIKIQ